MAGSCNVTNRGISFSATHRARRAGPGTRIACVDGRGAVRGRGRRPRRPARPWASPMASRGRGAPRTSRPTRCARAVRVRTWRACANVACVCGARCACADMARCVVGADVLGGPRARGRPRWRPVGNGAPRTSRPTMGVWNVVGADVPGGPRPRCHPRCRPVGKSGWVQCGFVS